MLSRRARLPVTIVRPSIVVGERGTGWTASFNVVYGPLRAFASGTYLVLPGRRDAVLDIVSVDHVADAILALAASAAAAGKTFHVVAGEHATTLGELARLAARRFDRRAPRLIPPRIYRSALHPLMLRRADPDTRRRLVRSEIYFPYFSLDLRFNDHRARELLDPLGIRATPLREYFDTMIDFAEAAHWGRTPIGRARAGALGQRTNTALSTATRGRARLVIGATRAALRGSFWTDGLSARPRAVRTGWAGGCRGMGKGRASRAAGRGRGRRPVPRDGRAGPGRGSCRTGLR